jgi:hypothetical protein
MSFIQKREAPHYTSAFAGNITNCRVNAQIGQDILMSHTPMAHKCVPRAHACVCAEGVHTCVVCVSCVSCVCVCVLGRQVLHEGAPWHTSTPAGMQVILAPTPTPAPGAVR